jgi:hypothetical protein
VAEYDLGPNCQRQNNGYDECNLNQGHGSFGWDVLLAYNIYQARAVEKELETGLSRGKIGIFHFSAGVAQLVEHFLAKEDVASSSLVTRFFLYQSAFRRG